MRTITRQELKARLEAGEDIKLVMAVGGWTFRARHIPGSLGFPSPSCALRELGRDDDIVVYSTDQHLQNSAAAFDALTATAAAMSAATPAGWPTGRTPAIRWRATALTRPPPTAGPTGTAPRARSWTAAARTVTTAGPATAGRQREPPIRVAGAPGNPGQQRPRLP
jgi:hypothetical protein